MLKFSKRPGDDFLIPIITISSFAFIFQIAQIAISNLLIEKSNLVLLLYALPIIFFIVIIFTIYLDNFSIRKFLNV